MYNKIRNMKKRLYVTVVTQSLNEEGELLLEKASETKDEDGSMPVSWYIDNGLKPPKDLEDDIERDEEGNVILDEKHLEYGGISYAVPIERIVCWGENSEIGSNIYLEEGIILHVFEEEEELDDMIDYLQMSWLEKRVAYFKMLLTNKQNT